MPPRAPIRHRSGSHDGQVFLPGSHPGWPHGPGGHQGPHPPSHPPAGAPWPPGPQFHRAGSHSPGPPRHPPGHPPGLAPDVAALLQPMRSAQSAESPRAMQRLSGSCSGGAPVPPPPHAPPGPPPVRSASHSDGYNSPYPRPSGPAPPSGPPPPGPPPRDHPAVATSGPRPLPARRCATTHRVQRTCRRATHLRHPPSRRTPCTPPRPPRRRRGI